MEALVFEVNTLPPPQSVMAPGVLRVELRLANGQCFNKGCVEGKLSYTCLLIVLASFEMLNFSAAQ